MKLLRLRLDNFRQHIATDIRFADGMTAIVGANGAGKTTILEAITFALYGVQRKTKESIRFFWAEPRSKMRVTLDFVFEGRSYRLERTTTDSSLIDVTLEPHTVKATGLSEVKSACERLLRLTYDQFKNSFCAEQKNLTFLQFNTHTRRQEQVAKMLGFDRLKLAAELARERGKIYRGEAEGIAQTIGDPVRLRSELQESKDELAKAKTAQKLATELCEVLSAQVKPAEERKALADEYFRLTQDGKVFKGQEEALESSRKRAEEAAAKAESDARRLRELLPAQEECNALEMVVQELGQLREIELGREKIAAELTRLEAEIGAVGQKIAALGQTDIEAARKAARDAGANHTNAMNELRAAEAVWSKSKQDAQAGLSTAQAELKQATAALTKAQELARKGICPECGQPTTATAEARLKCLLAELETAEMVAREAITLFQAVEIRPKVVFDAEEVLDTARTASARAQEDLNAAEKIDAHAGALREERAEKTRLAEVHRLELSKSIPLYDRKRHVEAEARLRELKPKRDECLRLAGAEERLATALSTLEAAKKEIEEARVAFLKLKTERDKLPFASSGEATEALAQFEEIRLKVSAAAAQKEQAEMLAKHSLARLEQAEERIKTYERDEANLKERRSQALLHETADKELKLLREELNLIIRPDLEVRASENLSLLTNGRYPVLELDEEFIATVIEDGIQKHVISGGEEDIVALALRMALSELIQERQGRPMSLMILDEVFGSLDADRRQAVLERLQAIRGRFAQILVISHIEEINQVADQCMFLTRDEKSRATVVGDLPFDSGDLVLRG